MCRLTIEIDQAVHTLAPIFDLVDASSFCVRSIRLAPVGFSRKADVHLSLAGGSKLELDRLLGSIRLMPAVLSTQHIIPPEWSSTKAPA